jgi:hypothetical protein
MAAVTMVVSTAGSAEEQLADSTAAVVSIAEAAVFMEVAADIGKTDRDV